MATKAEEDNILILRSTTVRSRWPGEYFCPASDGVMKRTNFFAIYLRKHFESDSGLQNESADRKPLILDRRFSNDFYFLPGWTSLTTGLTLYVESETQERSLQRLLALLTGRSPSRQQPKMIYLPPSLDTVQTTIIRPAPSTRAGFKHFSYP